MKLAASRSMANHTLILLHVLLLLSSGSGSRLRAQSSDKATSSCVQLDPDETLVVESVRQPHNQGVFFVTHQEGVKMAAGHAALFSLVDALVDGCKAPFRPGRVQHPVPWLLDVSPGLDEASGLASSLGCAVAAVNPDASGAPQVLRRVKAMGCLNSGDKPFVVVPAMAAATDGGNVTLAAPTSDANGSAGITNASAPASSAAANTALIVKKVRRMNRTKPAVPGVSLDRLFGTGAADGVTSLASAEDIETMRGADIALLKVTPHRCCGGDGVLNALTGAKGLFEAGRVKCMMAEMTFETGSTEALIDVLHELEHLGYGLLQAGPLDSVNLEVTSSGTYPLFLTDARQLRELYEKLQQIRRFDERSGYRVYDDGLSLDRDGRYFDYTNLIVACQGRPPSRLVLKGKAKLRFKDGTWWPEAESDDKGGH